MRRFSSTPAPYAEASSTTEAVASSATPVDRHARAAGRARVFSYTISAVSAAIHTRLATPAANITSISAQQQPRQKMPWRAPRRKPPPAPRS